MIKDDNNLWTLLDNGNDLGRNRRHRQYYMDRFIQGIQGALETRR